MCVMFQIDAPLLFFLLPTSVTIVMKIRDTLEAMVSNLKSTNEHIEEKMM